MSDDFVGFDEVLNKTFDIFLYAFFAWLIASLTFSVFFYFGFYSPGKTLSLLKQYNIDKQKMLIFEIVIISFVFVSHFLKKTSMISEEMHSIICGCLAMFTLLAFSVPFFIYWQAEKKIVLSTIVLILYENPIALVASLCVLFVFGVCSTDGISIKTLHPLSILSSIISYSRIVPAVVCFCIGTYLFIKHAIEIYPEYYFKFLLFFFYGGKESFKYFVGA